MHFGNFFIIWNMITERNYIGPPIFFTGIPMHFFIDQWGEDWQVSQSLLRLFKMRMSSPKISDFLTGCILGGNLSHNVQQRWNCKGLSTQINRDIFHMLLAIYTSWALTLFKEVWMENFHTLCTQTVWQQYDEASAQYQNWEGCFARLDELPSESWSECELVNDGPMVMSLQNNLCLSW